MDSERLFEVATIERNGRSRICVVGAAARCHEVAKECAGLPPETPDAEHYRGPDYDGPRYREPGPLFSVRPHGG